MQPQVWSASSALSQGREASQGATSRCMVNTETQMQDVLPSRDDLVNGAKVAGANVVQVTIK